MPLDVLNGKTPDEAFGFKEPFPDKLNTLIKNSYHQRIAENKSANCINDTWYI